MSNEKNNTLLHVLYKNSTVIIAHVILCRSIFVKRGFTDTYLKKTYSYHFSDKEICQV